ncbi:MAG TPA: Asp-tRNA(Asn)/Glu-tRNA(Gln) amidotransferase subunit GatB [Chloroflexia bacterium]|nr:Asp-tRNA(Asn)/Glu-tRNA(Gln) amidotransferase subunit GatB [Chloroflexia bacterium]
MALELETKVEYEAVIGLETHIQLMTNSKMFCGCRADDPSAAPNTNVCPVCLGMPGVLPVINSKAIEYIVKLGTALHCEIPEYSKFDRKNYFYPDLVKGYQISQFDLPVCINGWLEIEVDGRKKKIGITRIHQEEDTGKLVHMTSPDGQEYTLVDYNRSGVPLMECVSEPDISSPEEAAAYLTKLRQIVRWLGIGTGNMNEGAMRCDANVSIMPKGSKTFGTKIEIKNMNSIQSVHDAIAHEIKRQAEELEAGHVLKQQTRGWDEAKQITVFQRLKEGSSDYRYFPEPDLPPLQLSSEYREAIRASLPELPDARRDRFASDYGLPEYDANLLTSSRATADWFETALGSNKTSARAKAVSNWILNELFARLKESGAELTEASIKPEQLNGLIELVEKGTITPKTAKDVFEEMFNTGRDAADIVKEKGLGAISDESAIAAIVEKVIADNPKAVADLKAGKESSFNFLIGGVMKATQGKANKDVVTRLLRERL